MIVLSILSGSFSGRYRFLLVDLCPCAFLDILIPPSVSCVVLVSGLYRTDVIIRFAFAFFLILRKLTMIFPPFRAIVAKHLRDHSNLTPELMEGSLFLDLIRSLPHYPEHLLVFVIDALDKCGSAQSRPRLLEALTNAAAQALWLKIIVTSRPEVDIQHFFDTLTQSSYYHMTWPQIKMPVLICKPSPEPSSIWWPCNGISTPCGPKNRISTELSLGRTVFSSSLRLLSLLFFHLVRTLKSP